MTNRPGTVRGDQEHRSATWMCRTCGFDIWSPISVVSDSSKLGLYDDSRFPGRCILMLNEHFTHLDEVPTDLAASFMRDIADVAAAIRRVTECARVNVAILGNEQPHVHAHLIPRFPEAEAYPHDAPWKDQRPWAGMDAQVKDRIIEELHSTLMLRADSSAHSVC